MAVYIARDGTEYRDIKSVSFTPEYDPRMQSLPICEFTAEIVCDDPVENFKGERVDLYHIVPVEINSGYDLSDRAVRLAKDYFVTSAEKIAAGVISITAKSEIYILEQRTLFSKMYRNTPIADFLYDIFESDEADGYSQYGPVTDYIDEPYSGTGTVNMYCPAQTARERLLWYCIAYGRRVIQWNDGTYSDDQTPYSVRIVANKYAMTLSESVFIPPWCTYKQPVKKYVSTYNALEFYELVDYTSYERTGDNIRKVVIGADDLPEGLEPEDAETWYLQFDRREYERDDDVFAFDTAKIKDDILIYSPSTVFKKPWFFDYEVELEMYYGIGYDSITLRTHPYMPGQCIRFYIDENTICGGIVKSVGFTFGALERLKLVIATDMKPLETVPVTIRYTANGAPNGVALTLHYTGVPDSWFYVQTPQYIITRSGDQFLRFRSFSRMGYAAIYIPDTTSPVTRDIVYNG